MPDTPIQGPQDAATPPADDSSTDDTPTDRPGAAPSDGPDAQTGDGAPPQAGFPPEEPPSSVMVVIEEEDDPEILAVIDQLGRPADGGEGPGQPNGSLIDLPKDTKCISAGAFAAAGGSTGLSARPDPAQGHSGSSLADIVRQIKQENLTRLRELYGKVAEGFAEADNGLLEDAVEVLINGIWVRDGTPENKRLREMLYTALPTLDRHHFRPNDDESKIVPTKTLCRSLFSILDRKFKDDPRVCEIADKLRKADPPYDGSGAVPLPANPDSKKRP